MLLTWQCFSTNFVCACVCVCITRGRNERAAVTVCQKLNCADPSRAGGTVISWENKIIYYSSREKAKTINKLGV